MSTMIKCRKISFLFEICLCLMFIVPSLAKEECDKTKCRGPLRFYDDLRCKPIYKNPGDCCAKEYDCSHLENRSAKKCYINDNIYEIGDKLKDEDALPCDIGCVCGEGYNGNDRFTCAVIDCFAEPKPGCPLVQYGKNCCARPVCHGDFATCIVDGKTYTEGEKFEAKGEPEKECTCQEGYKGENVKPFCYIPSKSSICRTELKHSSDIREKCAPVYDYGESPQTGCSHIFRCQNNNDFLIPSGEEYEDDATCTFGNILMRIGDELNHATSYGLFDRFNRCITCKCEVPPTPTCQRRPDDACNETVHLKFDNF